MFIRWGVNLPMSVGAIAMNLSTIIWHSTRSFSVAQNWDLEGYAGFLASAQNTMTFPFCDRAMSRSLLWNFAGT
jgi:hypothetical protein